MYIYVTRNPHLPSPSQKNKKETEKKENKIKWHPKSQAQAVALIGTSGNRYLLPVESPMDGIEIQGPKTVNLTRYRMSKADRPSGMIARDCPCHKAGYMTRAIILCRYYVLCIHTYILSGA